VLVIAYRHENVSSGAPMNLILNNELLNLKPVETTRV
jgi:hypothetical protein